MLENYSIDDQIRIYQEPRKKFKPSLSIEINDPFSESTTNKYLLQQNTPNSSSFTSKNFSNKFCPTSTSPRNQNEVNQSCMLKNPTQFEIDRQYDDYYFEEECFNVSMQKCHRRTMEDRVILLLLKSY